jgi:hypothetical protein
VYREVKAFVIDLGAMQSNSIIGFSRLVVQPQKKPPVFVTLAVSATAILLLRITTKLQSHSRGLTKANR